MTGLFQTTLPHRGLITVGGADRKEFLQGLVSNDVTRANEQHALWAAFLTPQGKYLHDFFMIEIGETLHLDCEGGDDLIPMVICHIPRDDPGAMTANLRGPIVVNAANRRGRQIILKDETYAFDHRVFPEASAKEQPGAESAAT